MGVRWKMVGEYRLEDLFGGVEPGDMEKAVPQLDYVDQWFLMVHLRGYTLHPSIVYIVLTRLLNILNGRKVNQT